MGRGLLTNTDREWLQGEKEYKNKQTELNKRQDIRDRVFEAFDDFALLTEEFPKEDRQKIFKHLHEESKTNCVEEASQLIEFIYAGLNDLATDPEPIANYPNSEAISRFLAFRRALVKGISRGKEEFNQSNITGESTNHVTIASNAFLYELPDSGGIRAHTDTDQWREVNQGFMYKDSTSYEDVVAYMEVQAHYEIEDRMVSEHRSANKDIKDYTDFEEIS